MLGKPLLLALSQDRIDRLNSIGFDWTPPKGGTRKRKDPHRTDSDDEVDEIEALIYDQVMRRMRPTHVLEPEGVPIKTEEIETEDEDNLTNESAVRPDSALSMDQEGQADLSPIHPEASLQRPSRARPHADEAGTETRPLKRSKIGKTKGVQCMCGQAKCKQLSARFKAIGGDACFIPIPRARPPKKQTSLIWKHEAQLNAIVCKRLGLPPGSSGKLSILHWSEVQRPNMLENEKKISCAERRNFRAIFRCKEDANAIKQLRQNGRLGDSDKTDGGMYWNIPRSIDESEEEIRKKEIEEGLLTTRVAKKNPTKRQSKPYDGETLRDILSSEETVANLSKLEDVPVKTEETAKYSCETDREDDSTTIEDN